LTESQAAELFARVKRYSTADEVEVAVFGNRSALTRFANNAIHQNVDEENTVVSVRSVFAGSTARATSNKLDDDSLRRVTAASESLARIQHPDPDLLSMAAPGEASAGQIAIPQRYFPETAAMTPQSRAESVAKIVEVSRRHKFNAAG